MSDSVDDDEEGRVAVPFATALCKRFPGMEGERGLSCSHCFCRDWILELLETEGLLAPAALPPGLLLAKGGLRGIGDVRAAWARSDTAGARSLTTRAGSGLGGLPSDSPPFELVVGVALAAPSSGRDTEAAGVGPETDARKEGLRPLLSFPEPCRSEVAQRGTTGVLARYMTPNRPPVSSLTAGGRGTSI